MKNVIPLAVFGVACGLAAAAEYVPTIAYAPPQPPTEMEALAQKLAADPKIAAGTFQPTWESLTKNYECPEWFRDLKFGIWAHWSAQCQPEHGDWYAREMYIQGTRTYDSHVKEYGHPSKFGFMEIENLWKADKWEPEKLMALYKRAGAKYFFALANHHDNFDTYDSKYQPWNSTKIGPKKDIIGTWAKVARDAGMKFGVSNHASHTWHWFQVAYHHDVEGPLAGVPYDAATLTKEDGKGKWWEGLDPKDLYGSLRIPMSPELKTAKEAQGWHWNNDGHWFETIPQNDNGYSAKWFLRAQDLVDKYKPDMVYFDDTELPLEKYGLAITAHYYNSNLKPNGKTDVVVFAKKMSPERAAALVPDIERGVAEGIRPYPWQTDTCIGAWHYDRAIFNEHRYKSAGQVVRMLIDIVSKNGNLLLSVPIRGNGTLDEDEIEFLEEMGQWMEVNGEGIYATRPWAIYGEGPATLEKAEAGHFGGHVDVRSKPYTAEDIRFTKKGDTVYAFLFAWPENQRAVVKAMATQAPGLNGSRIERVSLVGSTEKVEWSQTADGLAVSLPAKPKTDHAWALKIETKH